MSESEKYCISPVFELKEVMSLLDKNNHFNEIYNGKHIFVTLDTAAGGSPFSYAITSCLHLADERMVVSIFFA